jgi:hypothetical protein
MPILVSPCTDFCLLLFNLGSIELLLHVKLNILHIGFVDLAVLNARDLSYDTLLCTFVDLTGSAKLLPSAEP